MSGRVICYRCTGSISRIGVEKRKRKSVDAMITSIPALSAQSRSMSSIRIMQGDSLCGVEGVKVMIYVAFLLKSRIG